VPLSDYAPLGLRRCAPEGLDHAPLTGHNCPMKQLVARFMVFAVSAALAALWLGYFLHDEFGIPRHAVRNDALLSAALAGGLVIIGLYSHRFGKRN
jgi:hypothetical protein